MVSGEPCGGNGDDCQVIGEIFEFGQVTNSSQGVFDGEVVIDGSEDATVPEPATIIGLLTISGLGLGLKHKKQS